MLEVLHMRTYEKQFDVDKLAEELRYTVLCISLPLHLQPNILYCNCVCLSNLHSSALLSKYDKPIILVGLWMLSLY